MDILLRSTAVALTVAAVCLLIKRSNPEIAMLLGICGSVVILAAAFRLSDGLMSLTETVKTMTGTSSRYIAPLLKCAAISVTTKIGTSLCRDASQNSAAAGLELVGTVCALGTALPLIINMLNMIGELV